MTITPSILIVLTIPLFAQSDHTDAKDSHGLLTIFREKGHGNDILKGYESIIKHDLDHAGAKASWEFFIDGIDKFKLTNGVFVTLKLSAGQHEIRVKRAEPDPLIIDLHPGEHLYIRPYVNGKLTQMLQHYFLRPVPCSEAVSSGIDAKPIRPKNVVSFASLSEIVPEQRFPSQCSN